MSQNPVDFARNPVKKTRPQSWTNNRAIIEPARLKLWMVAMTKSDSRNAANTPKNLHIANVRLGFDCTPRHQDQSIVKVSSYLVNKEVRSMAWALLQNRWSLIYKQCIDTIVIRWRSTYRCVLELYLEEIVMGWQMKGSREAFGRTNWAITSFYVT